MIKRPLNSRFREPVLQDVKVTTIRDNPWPVGEPIMLFNWEGAPYRSKHVDVAPVVVQEVRQITITHREDGGIIYAYGEPGSRRLHETEGFASRAEMDAWFRNVVPNGRSVTKWLMAFRRMEERV